MYYELAKLYFKYNDEWLYNHIEKNYPDALKNIIYTLLSYRYEKEIKKYIKKLLKNTWQNNQTDV